MPPTSNPKAPTGELGAPGVTSGLDGWLDTYEDTPELRWPNNVHVYDRMRVDAHIEGCLDATTLPIERSAWDLTPDSVEECRPEVVQLVREDLGLAVKGTHLRRPRGGVDFGDYRRHALLELVFGHMLFEQSAELINEQWRLRKLAPRMPRTINGWDLDAHGGLQGIKQLVPRPNGMWDEVPIGIGRLVVMTRRKEGSDPTGRSILRSCYIHWRMKQDLIKVDAMACERNGMGLAEVTYNPERMKKTEALDIASNVRVGEYAGLALEEGAAKLDLKGTTGAIREILPSIKYHDQEMSRRMLAMFLDLGQDNGARSLGETFVDFFVMSLQATADHIAAVTNEHVIRDLVEWNYGPDEPYPLIACDEITADSDLTAEALKALADGGYLTPDDAMEDFFRKRYKFPGRTPGTPRPDPKATTAAPTGDQLAAGTIARLQERFDEAVAKLGAGPRAVPTRVPSGP